MTNVARTNSNAIAIGEKYGFEQEKVELIKSQIAQGASNDELALFLYTAQRVGLDPLAKQIYCIMRKDRGVEKMTIQTGIDGYRLIADRTGSYAPGRSNTFEYDDQGNVTSATAYVMKWVRGAWLEVGATAYWDEYVAMYNGKPMGLWNTKPRVMLGKCAEALALRRAFPAELSGIYTAEEMGAEMHGNAEVISVQPAPRIPAPVNPLAQQAFDLQSEVYELDNTFVGKSLEKLQTFDQQKLVNYRNYLASRRDVLLAPAIVEAQAIDDDADDLWTELPTHEPSEAESAFFENYGAMVGGMTWNHVQQFFGRPYPRPSDDEGWEGLALAVNARLTEELAAR